MDRSGPEAGTPAGRTPRAFRRPLGPGHLQLDKGAPMSEKTMGQVAFEAYCEAVGGVAYDGKPIPGWWELSGETKTVQGGWEAAAMATVEWYDAHSGCVTFGIGATASPPPEDYRNRQQARWAPVGNPPAPGEVQ